MTDLKRAGQQLQGHVQDAARTATHHAAPALEALARVGYASKGVVYGMLGFLALSVAVGRGGATTDTQGALLRLQDLPGGSALMWLLVVGLVGYALWQLLRALLDPEHHGTKPGALVKRTGYLLSGGANVALAVFAARVALYGGARHSTGGTASAAETVLRVPGGQLLLGLVAVALFALAGSQLYTAYGAKFMKRMAFTDLGARYQGTLKRVGQVGIASRGVLSAIIGGFVLAAAWRHSAGTVVGVSGALTWLHGQPAGKFLLGAVALGTLCYGVWCAVQAVYRRIRVEG
ncbi:hypothetical protein HNQ07_001490 [Deinococcus metalli]|uniref:Membrane protein n=1 Tax=Deinococcus metalli TaxID=1141878 RepID=A0A7W8KE26_9DEIO|nr:DUF1206 domain-containing protein [Deinococcus metalli]MBB5376033.1 hypothetical protein [Deinococcus metalli]GHF41323.1 membrane protein [Deinococcus metalli]